MGVMGRRVCYGNVAIDYKWLLSMLIQMARGQTFESPTQNEVSNKPSS